MNTFAVLQLSGCAGCEVSLLNTDTLSNTNQLVYMPLVISSHDLPEVHTLLVSGGVRRDEDLYNLRRSVKKAEKVIAVGTCAIAGGVASLGDRDEVRDLFLAKKERYFVPHLLPRCHPIDDFVAVDYYLPGCPPTPELFTAALGDPASINSHRIVCVECRRKKDKGQRPDHLVGFQRGKVAPELCLINQGFLCIGSSTRNGCGAPCPRAGHPCVGCRGPSDNLIEKESSAWLESIQNVFATMTDIPAEEVKTGLLSPQMAMFLFQFSDYASTQRPPRPKQKVL
jgi:F420-non-reducing hydrogenase small subunit